MTLDARGLRTLGESVDGQRGTLLSILEENDGAGNLKYSAVPKPDAEATVLASGGKARIIIDAVEPVIKQRAEVRPAMDVKKPDGSGYTAVPPGIVDTADALFVTESAVEKFVWPYYEGMRIWDPGYLARLKKAYYDSAKVVAIAHFHPSAGQTVDNPISGDEPNPDQDPNAPFFLYYNPGADFLGVPRLLTAAQLLALNENR